jgi:hypothetical protein
MHDKVGENMKYFTDERNHCTQAKRTVIHPKGNCKTEKYRKQCEFRHRLWVQVPALPFL